MDLTQTESKYIMEIPNMEFWLILLIQIIIGLFIAFIASYAKKKANNLADKSDLEELTNVVESVKRKHSEELELLKANLDIISSKHTELFNEEKKSLLDFYYELNVWFYSKLNINLADFNYVRVDELSDMILDIHDTYNNVNVLFSKFKILTTNTNLIKKGHELIQIILDYHQFIEKNMRSLKLTLALEKGSVETISNYIEERREIPNDGKKFISELTKFTEERKQNLFGDFYDKKLEKFSEVLKQKNEFEAMVNKHLTN